MTDLEYLQRAVAEMQLRLQGLEQIVKRIRGDIETMSQRIDQPDWKERR